MIRDGKGRGYLAEVDQDNHLHTFSSTRSRMAYVSADKHTAYSIYGRRNFAASGTDEAVLFFKYTGTKRFFVDKIMFAGNGANNKAELYASTTYSTGGTSGAAVNVNLTSALTLSADIYTGQTDLTVTKGTEEIIDVRFGVDTETVDFAGALVMGQDDNIYIVGEVGTVGNKIRVMILGFEEEGGLT